MTAFDWPALHVYEWADLHALARAFAGPVLHADITGRSGRRIALQAIADQLHLPAYVKPNLDSIEEAWRDLSWLAGDRWLIAVAGCRDLRRADHDTFAALCDIAQNAIRDQAERGVQLSFAFVLNPAGEDFHESY